MEELENVEDALEISDPIGEGGLFSASDSEPKENDLFKLGVNLLLYFDFT